MRTASSAGSASSAASALRIVTALIATASGVSGCHACTDEVVDGPKVDGPVKAEFKIYKEAWGKISRSAPVRYGFLAIEAKQPIEHKVGCYEPERHIAGAPDGVRFAYRCDKSSEWEVVYAGTHGHAWTACETSAGSSEAPDWSKLPDLDGARAELVGCAYDSDVLFAEAALDAPDKMGALLRDTAGVRTGRDKLWSRHDPELELGEDAWLRARAKADDGAKKTADDALRAGLEKKGSGAHILHRALLVLPWKEIAIATLAARAEEVAMQEKWSWADDRAVTLAIRVLAVASPKQAGELACRALGHPATTDGNTWALAGDHLTVALAASKTACPEVVKDLGCGHFDCGDDESAAPCTTAQLEALLAEEMKKDPILAAAESSTIGSPRALLLVGRQNGGIPEGFDLRHARLHYEQVGATPCWSVTERGAACTALTDQTNIDTVLCTVDPKETKTKRGRAIITIDDQKKQLVAHQQCDDEPVCSTDIDCCPGKTCQKDFCRVPGALSAAASASPSASVAPGGSVTP